jgi:hypothetical protein
MIFGHDFRCDAVDGVGDVVGVVNVDSDVADVIWFRSCAWMS